MAGLLCDSSEAMEIAMFLLPPTRVWHHRATVDGWPWDLERSFPGGSAMGPAHAAPHIQPAGQSELHGPSTIEANLELV